jgi:hypothetical protein
MTYQESSSLDLHSNRSYLRDNMEYRHRVVHCATTPNLITTIKSLEYRILEHVDDVTLNVHVVNKVVDCWKKSPPDTVKLNTDAALLK